MSNEDLLDNYVMVSGIATATPTSTEHKAEGTTYLEEGLRSVDVQILH